MGGAYDGASPLVNILCPTRHKTSHFRDEIRYIRSCDILQLGGRYAAAAVTGYSCWKQTSHHVAYSLGINWKDI